MAASTNGLSQRVLSPLMQESTRLRLEGNWNEWKGRLRSKWGDLTDDDLDRAQGDTERLVGIIQQRTGEKVENINRRLDEMVNEQRR